MPQAAIKVAYAFGEAVLFATKSHALATLAFSSVIVGAAVLTNKAFSAFLPDFPTYGNLDRRQMLELTSGGIEPGRIIYGRARVGGVLAAPPMVSPTNPEYLFFVVIFAAHQIEGYEKIYLGESVIDVSSQIEASGDVNKAEFIDSDSNKLLRIKLYDGTQSNANAEWDNEFTEVTSNHKLQGLAYAVFRLTLDETTEPTVFQSGPPRQFTADIKGKKVLDHRSLATNFNSWYLSNATRDDKGLEWYECEDTSAGAWGYFESGFVSVAANTPYTIRCRVKKDNIGRATRFPLWRFYGPSGYADFYIDTATGEKTQAAGAGLTIESFTVEKSGNEWIIDAAVSVSVAASIYMRFFPEVGASQTWAVSAGVTGNPIKIKNLRLNAPPAWSQNVALCIRDYLTNELYGLDEPTTRIDETNFDVAADICDETVTVRDNAAGTTTQNRWTCNGVLSTATPPRQNLEELTSAMGGTVAFAGSGEWRCFPAAYVTPTVDLDESYLAGPITILPQPAAADRANKITGSYVAHDRGGIPIAIPEKTLDNLLSNPEDFLSWAIGGSPTRTANTDFAPDGTLTADTIGDNAASYEWIYSNTIQAPGGMTHYFAIHVKKDDTARSIRFPGFSISWAPGDYVNIALDTKTGEFDATESGSSVIVASGVQDKGDYWRPWIAFSDSVNESFSALIYPAMGPGTGAEWSWNGNETGSIVVAAADCRPGSAPIDYRPEQGIDLRRNLQLGMTSDTQTAQRLAVLARNQARQFEIVEMVCNLKAFAIEVMDTVTLTLDELGWQSKVFRVIGWKFQGGNIVLTLKAESAAAFAVSWQTDLVDDPEPATV